MSLGSLVVKDGDLVTAAGLLVADRNGLWLEPSTVVALGSPAVRGPYALRLDGESAVLREPDQGPPWTVAVTGVLSGDTLRVVRQEASGAALDVSVFDPDARRPPPGLWSSHDEVERLLHDASDRIRELLADKTLLRLTTVEGTPGHLTVRAETEQPDAVEAALRPLLGGTLWLLPRRWTRERFDRVFADALEHFDSWKVIEAGEARSRDGHPCVHLRVARMTDGLAAWANALEPGLVRPTVCLWPTPV